MPTNVYREFPTLKDVPGYMMARLILEARLSPKDVQIATARLMWGMEYQDIGAAVGMHRNAVSERMREVIAPRLSEIWPWISGERAARL